MFKVKTCKCRLDSKFTLKTQFLKQFWHQSEECIQVMLFKKGAGDNGYTSGSLYNLIVLCIVIFRFKWENLTSINFLGFIDRCQYLKHEKKNEANLLVQLKIIVTKTKTSTTEMFCRFIINYEQFQALLPRFPYWLWEHSWLLAYLAYLETCYEGHLEEFVVVIYKSIFTSCKDSLWESGGEWINWKPVVTCTCQQVWVTQSPLYTLLEIFLLNSPAA